MEPRLLTKSLYPHKLISPVEYRLQGTKLFGAASLKENEMVGTHSWLQ
jgi:hypothetical protein